MCARKALPSTAGRICGSAPTVEPIRGSWSCEADRASGAEPRAGGRSGAVAVRPVRDRRGERACGTGVLDEVAEVRAGSAAVRLRHLRPAVAEPGTDLPGAGRDGRGTTAAAESDPFRTRRTGRFGAVAAGGGPVSRWADPGGGARAGSCWRS